MAKKKKKISDEELEKIIQMYRDELVELEEIKARNSARYSAMTDEELVAALAGETKQVYEHATGKKFEEKDESGANGDEADTDNENDNDDGDDVEDGKK